MNKRKIAYIDENRDEINKFQRRVYEPLSARILPKAILKFVDELLIQVQKHCFDFD